MAKTKPSRREKSKTNDLLRSTTTTNGAMKSKRPKKSIQDILTEAAALLHQSQPDVALPLVETALRRLETEVSSETAKISLPKTVFLLAETQLELGDADSARSNLSRVVRLDPIGGTAGAEPFLWLAQLSEEGGLESVAYIQQGTTILRREITALEEKLKPGPDEQILLMEKKQKLSDALCSMAEVYMTDLSFEADAEARCEALVTEALMVLPDSPSALQTLASVRISQLRVDDARSALKRSMELWEHLPPGDLGVPDFPTRISLARLLMEVEVESEAMKVLERLVSEDDQSVEAWYLGGWCQVLLSEKGNDTKKGAWEWLRNSLRLYDVLGYEDEKLRDHANELVALLAKELGIQDADEEDWEDEEDEDVDNASQELEMEADGDDDEKDEQMNLDG